MPVPTLPAADERARRRALDVLLSGELAPIVDFVAWAPAPDRYHVASVEGEMRFTRRADSAASQRWAFEPETLAGRDPIARQDPAAFGNLADEQADPHPGRAANSYPHAFEHIAQIFDHPSAPDLVVQHSAAHFWGDQGGHIGEHGSLGIVQARAPRSSPPAPGYTPPAWSTTPAAWSTSPRPSWRVLGARSDDDAPPGARSGARTASPDRAPAPGRPPATWWRC